MQVEFIRAATIALNIKENNVIVNATIEELTMQIKKTDYIELLVYLVKRKSGYETPLERLAKGIDEFYADRKRKIIKYANEHAATLNMIINNLVKRKGKAGTIKIITAGSELKLMDNTVFTVTSQDIEALDQLGGLKQLLDDGYPFWGNLETELIKIYIADKGNLVNKLGVRLKER